MGIKERRTKILATLFFIKDFEFAPVTFTNDLQQTFDISMNPKTRMTFQDLIDEQIVIDPGQHNTNPDQPTYQLADKGFNELCLEFPALRFMKYQWDGKWRILSYEIPERKREMRDRLRRQVSSWGLGPWHRSFWITPHPIIPDLKQLVSNKEEEQYVQAFESEHVFGNRSVLIEKVWETSNLEKKYRLLFKSWHDMLSTQDSKFTKLNKVISAYIAILRQDPGLPTELVGDQWIGFEAIKLYKEIRKILL